MNLIKYLALDVHIASITIVVMSATGRIVLERSIATSAAEVRKFFKQLRGRLIVTFEEGTLSQWLYEIIQPLADQVIVCIRGGTNYWKRAAKEIRSMDANLRICCGPECSSRYTMARAETGH